MKNLPVQIKLVLAFIVVAILVSVVNKAYVSTVGLFNTTKESQLSYDKVVQEQVSNYDGYYQAFIDKQTNANINKETFIQVTDIIMSRRADGQNVSWKWLQENQQIPYEEFTVFYKELSAFISERYKDNMIIEQQKQEIVQQHNLLLSKYPNNIINKALDINKLTYKAGYISDYTKNKFK